MTCHTTNLKHDYITDWDIDLKLIRWSMIELTHKKYCGEIIEETNRKVTTPCLWSCVFGCVSEESFVLSQKMMTPQSHLRTNHKKTGCTTSQRFNLPSPDLFIDPVMYTVPSLDSVCLSHCHRSCWFNEGTLGSVGALQTVVQDSLPQHRRFDCHRDRGQWCALQQHSWNILYTSGLETICDSITDGNLQKRPHKWYRQNI